MISDNGKTIVAYARKMKWQGTQIIPEHTNAGMSAQLDMDTLPKKPLAFRRKGYYNEIKREQLFQ